MNKVLAWFITFNFVNIAFVFFRANEWDDAVKVLNSMFSLDNVVLPQPLEGRLGFLTDLGIEFGNLYGGILGTTIVTTIWLISGFIIILFLKNSTQIIYPKMPNKKIALYYAAVLICGIFSLNKMSEFLYFNF
jgi:hypothetical protein